MITKADVVAKFKELHAKHYGPHGYMVSIVSDEISDAFYACDRNSQFNWHNTYNRYASERVLIRSCRVVVPLMGRTFKIRLDRPFESEDRYEFESYFGFGGHCEGYNQNRTILCYPTTFDETIDIDELLLNGSTATDPADNDYAKQAMMLIVLGGYVKFWNALSEFEAWFANELGGEQYNTGNTLRTHIFETMEPEPLPEQVS